MSNYNTGNPVPSIDPRDLDDNATNFDELLLQPVPSVNDRLGVPRKTWWQMEQDALALISANVAALAGLAGAADRLPYFTGSGAMDLAVFTVQARQLLDDTSFAAMLVTLGAAARGSNSDITSLTGLTTALSVLQGGTGVTTTAALLSALVAAGAAVSSGVTDGSNAAAGKVGEFMTAAATGVSMSNNVAANLTSLSLTAGDWEVWGVFEPTPGGAGQPTSYGVGLNTVSATFPSYEKSQLLSVPQSLFRQVLASPCVRFKVTSTTTVYLVGVSGFSSGTLAAAATINARRVR